MESSSDIVSLVIVLAAEHGGVSSGEVWTAVISVGGIVLAGIAFLSIMAWRLGNRYADRTDGRLDRQSKRQDRLEGRFDARLGDLTLGDASGPGKLEPRDQ
ncbi:MAG: hypothetical protein F4138_02090 [Acidimicrobiia bacterium]|nr:hypothetical protein [Acidimicrobiia bacterium]